MKVFAAAVGGLAAAAAYVLLSGILEIQVSAMGWGVALNLSNEVTAVTGGRLAWLPTTTMAVLGALVAFLLVRSERVLPGTTTRIPFLLGFAVTILCLIVWSYFIESSFLTVAASETETGVGLARGITGWVQAGGQAAVVQLVGLIAVVNLVRRLPQVEPHPEKHPEAIGVRPRP